MRKGEGFTQYDAEIHKPRSVVKVGYGSFDPVEAVYQFSKEVAAFILDGEYEVLDFKGEPLNDIVSSGIDMAVQDMYLAMISRDSDKTEN